MSFGPGEELSDKELDRRVMALVYASPEPLTNRRLTTLLERPDPKRVKAALERVQECLAATELPLELKKIAGGWRILTAEDLDEVVGELVASRRTERMSPASLETLAPVLGAPEEDYTLLSAAMQARANRIVPQARLAARVRWNFGAYADPHLNRSDTASFRRVIHLSMLAQADCLRAETEHYRRGRDSPARTGGSLYLGDSTHKSPAKRRNPLQNRGTATTFK